MGHFIEYCQQIHDLPADGRVRLREIASMVGNDDRLTRWQRDLLLEQVFMKLEPHLRRTDALSRRSV